jgi:DNA mismatch endonuclease, patch repair protein
MTDNLSPEERSKNMGRIKGTDTFFEVEVRKYLFSKGFRFRKNDKRYIGKPDIVLPKFNLIIFIHGCFWHRHEGCEFAYTPKSRVEFWKKKFAGNIKRDKLVMSELFNDRWIVETIWECELKSDFSGRMEELNAFILALEKRRIG